MHGSHKQASIIEYYKYRDILTYLLLYLIFYNIISVLDNKNDGMLDTDIL